MRMKLILIFATVAAFSHIAFVISFPYIVVISSYFATRGEVKINEVYHEKPVDADFRKVVMPSPDILYSACIFDLSRSDLQITARVPKFTYWSASFYAINTDNFFTVNDRMVGEEFRVILSAREDCGECILSPSKRGIVIFRIFIPDRSLLPELMEYQASIRCEEISK